MKIAYVVEDFSENGGVERIVSQKANILATEYGHEVCIINVYRDNRPIRYHIDGSVRMENLDVPFADKRHGRILTLLSRVKTLLTARSRLNSTLKTVAPDIIFFTTTMGALLLPLSRTKARKVYESHLARQFNPYNALFSFMERSADTVVCLTEGDAGEYKHARRKVVIPNFIPSPETTVRDYGVKKAIAVGRLEKQKGFDILIDVWQKLSESHPDWHLDIYGEGSQHDELQQQIDRLSLHHSITLYGRSDRIMDVYPQYSLHLMPSRYEGQPITLIEAQSCGLPSVVTDFKYGAADIVKDGENGLIVSQNDTAAFASAATTLMDSVDMRREYGGRALKTGQKYSRENIMNMWIKLIGER